MKRLTLLLIAAVLVGCTSSQDVLEPSAIAPSESVAASPAPPASTAAVDPQPAAPARAPGSATASPRGASQAVLGARLQFAPIVGPSIEAATALSERLASRARQRGMSLAGSSDTSATHLLRGYFSTLTEGGVTTVVFVWDVYDPAGQRLHRIDGQQQAPASTAEGWAAIGGDTMEKVADSTIDQLAAWLSATAG